MPAKNYLPIAAGVLCVGLFWAGLARFDSAVRQFGAFTNEGKDTSVNRGLVSRYTELRDQAASIKAINDFADANQVGLISLVKTRSLMLAINQVSEMLAEGVPEDIANRLTAAEAAIMGRPVVYRARMFSDSKLQIDYDDGAFEENQVFAMTGFILLNGMVCRPDKDIGQISCSAAPLNRGDSPQVQADDPRVKRNGEGGATVHGQVFSGKDAPVVINGDGE